MSKVAYDTDCNATRAGMERFLRALVVCGGHFTDSFTLAPVVVPARGVSVFFRVWLKPGTERRFCELADVEIEWPARVSVGTEGPSDDESRCAVCGWGLVDSEEKGCGRSPSRRATWARAFSTARPATSPRSIVGPKSAAPWRGSR